MAVQTNNPNHAVVAAATLAPLLCVTALGALTAVSTANDIFGVTQEGGSTGDDVTVRQRTAGTAKVTVATAVTKGALLYKAAGGKLGTTATSSVAVAYALEDASGDGSVIEVHWI